MNTIWSLGAHLLQVYVQKKNISFVAEWQGVFPLVEKWSRWIIFKVQSFFPKEENINLREGWH